MIANPPSGNSPQVHAENYSEPAAVIHTADCSDCSLRRGRQTHDGGAIQVQGGCDVRDFPKGSK
jgi:hypothetical protein